MNNDSRPFLIIYNERIPNGIKNHLELNYIRKIRKQKNLSKKQAKSVYNYAILRKTEFLNLLNNGYFSDLGNIITDAGNWDLFRKDFQIFNQIRETIQTSFTEVNQIRIQVAHIVEQDEGEVNIVEELTKINICISRAMNFSFGLNLLI